jgi:hypothetical protein
VSGRAERPVPHFERVLVIVFENKARAAEDAWGLPRLGRSADAALITGILG